MFPSLFFLPPLAQLLDRGDGLHGPGVELWEAGHLSISEHSSLMQKTHGCTEPGSEWTSIKTLLKTTSKTSLSGGNWLPGTCELWKQRSSSLVPCNSKASWLAISKTWSLYFDCLLLPEGPTTAGPPRPAPLRPAPLADQAHGLIDFIILILPSKECVATAIDPGARILWRKDVPRDVEAGENSGEEVENKRRGGESGS